jgi:hypothetical protein
MMRSERCEKQILIAFAPTASMLHGRPDPGNKQAADAWLPSGDRCDDDRADPRDDDGTDARDIE